MKWLGPTMAVVLSATSLIPGASAQTTAPLTYAQPLSPAGVMAVQQRLKQAGAYPGRADGVWGRDSATALERFQGSNGLQVTGQLNQVTVATLGLNLGELLAGSPAGVSSSSPTAVAGEPLAPEVVRTIQGRLRQLGFYSGQTDGIWGPGMQSSIERFQQGRGLQATGQLNPATTTALGLDPNNLAGQPPVIAPVRWEQTTEPFNHGASAAFVAYDGPHSDVRGYVAVNRGGVYTARAALWRARAAFPGAVWCKVPVSDSPICDRAADGGNTLPFCPRCHFKVLGRQAGSHDCAADPVLLLGKRRHKIR